MQHDDDFGPHKEIHSSKRQREELAKTCSRFLDAEHILTLRQLLRPSHAVPAAPDALLLGGDGDGDGPAAAAAAAGRAPRTACRGAVADTPPPVGAARELQANHFAALLRVRVPTALVANGGVTLGNEGAVSKRVRVTSVDAGPGAPEVAVGDCLVRVDDGALPWQTSAAALADVLTASKAPWHEWYLWRATPDRHLDATELTLRVEKTLDVDFAPLDMLPDTPIPSISGLSCAVDVFDARRGLVDDEDHLQVGDIVVGFDNAPVENRGPLAALIQAARKRGKAPALTVLRANAPSTRFWIRQKVLQVKAQRRTRDRHRQPDPRKPPGCCANAPTPPPPPCCGLLSPPQAPRR